MLSCCHNEERHDHCCALRPARTATAYAICRGVPAIAGSTVGAGFETTGAATTIGSLADAATTVAGLTTCAAIGIWSAAAPPSRPRPGWEPGDTVVSVDAELIELGVDWSDPRVAEPPYRTSPAEAAANGDSMPAVSGVVAAALVDGATVAAVKAVVGAAVPDVCAATPPATPPSTHNARTAATVVEPTMAPAAGIRLFTTLPFEILHTSNAARLRMSQGRPRRRLAVCHGANARMRAARHVVAPVAPVNTWGCLNSMHDSMHRRKELLGEGCHK